MLTTKIKFLSHLDRWISGVDAKKGPYVLIVIFRAPNVMVSFRCLLNLFVMNHWVLFLYPANTGLASLYLRELLDERFTICTTIACFGAAMFKLSLSTLINTSRQQRQRY
jgi:hypothetical protein